MISSNFLDSDVEIWMYLIEIGFRVRLALHIHSVKANSHKHIIGFARLQSCKKKTLCPYKYLHWLGRCQRWSHGYHPPSSSSGGVKRQAGAVIYNSVWISLLDYSPLRMLTAIKRIRIWWRKGKERIKIWQTKGTGKRSFWAGVRWCQGNSTIYQFCWLTEFVLVWRK